MKILQTLPFVALMLLAGCAKTGPAVDTKMSAEKPIATVNGVPISRAMFDYYAKNTAGKTPTDLTPDQRAQILDNLVRGEVIAQQAEKDGLEKPGTPPFRRPLPNRQFLERAGAEQYRKA